MTLLAAEVASRLEMSSDDVDWVLSRHQVSSVALAPTPASVRFTRLQFSGTKTLTGVDKDGASLQPESVLKEPFSFDWELKTGLNGIGSDKNLRGKSSIIKLLLWALRGRCDLQNEVKSWVDSVTADIEVDGTPHVVSFQVDHENKDVAVGTLEKVHGSRRIPLGEFVGDDAFEEVMGAAMMSALRLRPIAAAHEGRRTQHAWPTYSGALVVRGDTLDYLLGGQKFAGLPSRLLSMFVGSQWAGIRAEVTTALTVAQADLAKLQRQAAEQSAAISDAYERALAEVETARRRLDEFPVPAVDISAVEDAISRVYDIDGEIARCAKLRALASKEHALVERQHEDEESRLFHAIEEAMAARFFQQLRPTVCPRCSTPVTADRITLEKRGHQCSVCTSHLSSDVPEEDKIVADSVAQSATDERLTEEHDSIAAEDSDDDVVDTLTALAEAMADAKSRVDRLDRDLSFLNRDRESLRTIVTDHRAAYQAARARTVAELALARAEGAAAALEPDSNVIGPDPQVMTELERDIKILNSAKTIITTWTQDGQREWLANLNSDIASLARDFGIANLTSVTIGGGATLRVTKGGSESNYGDCERGEKLRLKLATAVALIKQGRKSGIGRHPGLLLVDAPGAEEVTEDDFDTMLTALNREAESAGIQVIVATRHTEELYQLLGPERCRLGRNSNFVW